MSAHCSAAAAAAAATVLCLASEFASVPTHGVAHRRFATMSNAVKCNSTLWHDLSQREMRLRRWSSAHDKSGNKGKPVCRSATVSCLCAIQQKARERVQMAAEPPTSNGENQRQEPEVMASPMFFTKTRAVRPRYFSSIAVTTPIFVSSVNQHLFLWCLSVRQCVCLSARRYT